MREEYTGSLNENQKHLLSIVNHHAETLSESLDIFTMASRLLFSPKHIEIQEVNLLDRLAQLEKEFNKEKYPDLQIEKVIENDLSVFPFDVNPEWFIVHTITKLHRGEFSIDDSHKNECIFYLKVPLQQTDS